MLNNGLKFYRPINSQQLPWDTTFSDQPEQDVSPNQEQMQPSTITHSVQCMHSRIHNIRLDHRRHFSAPEPAPDYIMQTVPSPPITPDGRTCFRQSPIDEALLISPKKLKNPVLESRERQELHRELIINHRIGHNVLQKSELQKKLEDRENERKKKEWEEYRRAKRTSLEVMLEKQASKCEEEETKLKSIQEAEAQKPEYLKMHDKILAAKNSTAQTT